MHIYLYVNPALFGAGFFIEFFKKIYFAHIFNRSVFFAVTRLSLTCFPPPHFFLEIKGEYCLKHNSAFILPCDRIRQII